MANPQPQNGHVDIANEIMEQLAHRRLSGSQWQVLLFILRKTWGYLALEDGKPYKDKDGRWVKKKMDRISMGQIASGTGLHRSHVCMALKYLVEIGIVIKNSNTYPVSYGFNKDYDEWDPKILVTITENGNSSDDKPRELEEEKTPEQSVTEIGNSSETEVLRKSVTVGKVTVTENGNTLLRKSVTKTPPTVTEIGNEQKISFKDNITKDTGTLFSVESQKPKKQETPKIQELTPIQEIVEHYRTLILATDVQAKDEKAWNKKNFGRCSNTAAKLLEQAKNDVQLVKKGMAWVYTTLTKVGRTCVIETIYQSGTGVRHFENYLRDNPPKQAKVVKGEEVKINGKLLSDMTDEEFKAMREKTKEKLIKMGLNPAIIFKKKERFRVCKDLMSFKEIMAVN